MPNKTGVTEHGEQRTVIEWAFAMRGQWPELALLYSIPNGAMLGGGRIGSIRANILKAEGLLPGVCDLFIPSAKGGYFGLYLEMKIKGGKVSNEQMNFIKGVEEQGYRAAVCWSADEAIEILMDYMQKLRTTVYKSNSK